MTSTATRQENSSKTKITTKIKNKVSSGWKKLKNFCQKIKSCLGDIYRTIITYVAPKSEPTEGFEKDWIDFAEVAIVKNIEGKNPFNTYCKMSPVKRQETLVKTANLYSALLGITPYDIVFSDELPTNISGLCNHENKAIFINSELVNARPISEETAIEAINTIIHEVFHSYQHDVITNQKKHKGIPEDIVGYWRKNKLNYCTPKQNPILYRPQPLETYAYCVADNVTLNLMDKNVVQELRDILNEGEMINGLDK